MKVNKLEIYGIGRLVNKLFYFSRDSKKNYDNEGSGRKK